LADLTTTTSEPVLTSPVDAAVSGPQLSLLRHVSVYAVTMFCLRGLSFLLLALYSRYLPPAEYGVVALSDAIAYVVANLGGLGVNAAVGRLYFQYDSDPPVLRDYIATAFRLALGSVACFLGMTVLLGAGVARLYPRAMPVPLFPYVALSLVAASTMTIVELRLGLWQAQRRPTRYALFAGLVFAVTAAVSVVLVVFLRRGAVGLLAGKAIAGALCVAVALIATRNWLAGAWRPSYALQTLRLGMPLVPHQLLALGLVAGDRFILKHYRALPEVGIYSMAYTLGSAMYLVTLAVMLAWTPSYFQLARAGVGGYRQLVRASNTILLGLIAIAAFGTAIAQTFTRFFLDPRYSAAGRLVPWVISGYLFHAVFSLMQLPAMHKRRSGALVLPSSIALGLNIGLNLWWVPRWGMWGSAWATAVSYLIEAALMFAIGQRLFPVRFATKRLLLALAVYVMFFIVNESLPPVGPATLVTATAATAACFGIIAWSFYSRRMPCFREDS
jgi:O-antigen/teichoic acid export membrane protein